MIAQYCMFPAAWAPSALNLLQAGVQITSTPSKMSSVATSDCRGHLGCSIDVRTSANLQLPAPMEPGRHRRKKCMHVCIHIYIYIGRERERERERERQRKREKERDRQRQRERERESTESAYEIYGFGALGLRGTVCVYLCICMYKIGSLTRVLTLTPALTIHTRTVLLWLEHVAAVRRNLSRSSR